MTLAALVAAAALTTAPIAHADRLSDHSRAELRTTGFEDKVHPKEENRGASMAKLLTKARNLVLGDSSLRGKDAVAVNALRRQLARSLH